MVYQWKMPGLYQIPAQAAGEELARICKEHSGEMSPQVIVEESRPEAAPLHPIFEWNDTVAAEEWRKQQARQLVCCIVTRLENDITTTAVVRPFVHVSDSYRPIEVVVSEKDLQAELVRNALRDVEAFQRRLETFSTLRPVKQLRRSIDRTIQQLKDESRL